MATETNTQIVTKESPEDGGLVINNLHLRLLAVDRTMKDIKKFRDALCEAERIYSPNRTALYDLYATVILDGHLKGIIKKRRSSLVNKKLKFVKGGGVVDDDITRLAAKSKFRKMRKELFDQKLWGLSGLEFIPGHKFDFNCIPRKHIKPDVKMITQDEWGNVGIVYDGVWNLWIVGEVYEFGDLLECSPYAIWKKGNMGDWAQYIEIFGQPIIKIIYDGYNEKVRKELDDLAKNIASSTRILLPKEANMDVLDGKQTNGDGALQDTFRKACNQEMSVLVLGNTETTSSSDSSGYAQGKIHQQQQEEITDDDKIEELGLLNDEFFFTILKSFGYSPEGGEFVYDEPADLARLKDESAIDTFLENTVGLPLGDDYYYEKYNRPKPVNYSQLKKEKQQAAEQQQQQKFKNQFDEFEEKEDDHEAVKKVKRAARGFMQKVKTFFG